jgi:hypothetical protein
MTGTFIATRDEERGPQIAADVAENGWQSPAEQPTQPTTQPTPE